MSDRGGRNPRSRHGVLALALLVPLLSACEILWPERDQLGPACPETVYESVPTPEDARRFAVEGTDTTIEMKSIDVRGTGSSGISKIDVAGGVGTIEIGCRSMPLAIHRSIDGEQYRFFHALAVNETAIYAINFYCTYEGLLHSINYSGTDDLKFGGEGAEGLCDEDPGSSRKRIRFPSLSLAVATEPTGVTLSGPDIHVPEEGPGSIAIPGVPSELHVFHHSYCDSCEDDGEAIWHDLDALLWDPEVEELTYVNLSFDEGDEEVLVSPGIALPGFSTVEATWENLPATIVTD